MRTAAVIALMLTASTARAAEPPERELRMLGRCALAASVYRSLMPPAVAPVSITDADKALYGRMMAVDPRLRARADAVASELEPAARDAIGVELKAQYRAQMAPADGPRRSPREALDLYAPLLEACIARADMLPGP